MKVELKINSRGWSALRACIALLRTWVPFFLPTSCNSQPLENPKDTMPSMASMNTCTQEAILQRQTQNDNHNDVIVIFIVEDDGIILETRMTLEIPNSLASPNYCWYSNMQTILKFSFFDLVFVWLNTWKSSLPWWSMISQSRLMYMLSVKWETLTKQ